MRRMVRKQNLKFVIFQNFSDFPDFPKILLTSRLSVQIFCTDAAAFLLCSGTPRAARELLSTPEQVHIVARDLTQHRGAT